MATILLTGFPGFIGTRLARRLLADDPDARVVALVEERMAARAREVAATLDGAARVEVVTGDIAAPQLGLGAADHDRLAAEVTDVHHLAAIYDLAVPRELAERVNVQGTANVVAFCRAARHLERHHYVSTAYVAGCRHGVVAEGELEHDTGFKNHYEATKHAAEVVVRASMDDVPTTIHRPAIVVGDSRTGETQKFDGPYYLLRALDLLGRLGLAMPQIGSPQAPFNVVPVDFVVEAIATAAQEPAAAGETFHLVDPEPLSAAALLELLADLYAGRRPGRRIPSALFEAGLRMAPVRRVFANTPRQSIRYLNHSVRFDTARARAVLEPHGVRCPPFPAYAPVVVDFFTRHRRDPQYVPKGG